MSIHMSNACVYDFSLLGIVCVWAGLGVCETDLCVCVCVFALYVYFQGWVCVCCLWWVGVQMCVILAVHMAVRNWCGWVFSKLFMSWRFGEELWETGRPGDVAVIWGSAWVLLENSRAGQISTQTCIWIPTLDCGQNSMTFQDLEPNLQTWFRKAALLCWSGTAKKKLPVWNGFNLYQSVCLRVSLSLSLSPSPSLPLIFLSLFLCLPLPLCFSLLLSLSPSLPAFLSVSLPLSLSLCLSCNPHCGWWCNRYWHSCVCISVLAA